MTFLNPDLADFGWGPHWQAQLDLELPDHILPVRVMAVHRGGIDVAGPDLSARILPFAEDPEDPESRATVGDWLLLDRSAGQAVRRLERKSLLQRRAAGTGRGVQLIAANVDTLFVVTSCNQDFNPARLERYLALAREAEVAPVIVLTKADLTDSPRDFVRTAARLMAGLLVETVDARDRASTACLDPWCGPGQTVALLGSSGVGKSTLVNTLCETEQQATQGIRTGDDKGRHTTSGRSLHRLPAGGWLVDTPGMRELQLTDAEAGVADLFEDVVALAAECRFADCQHGTEPGCAIQAAIAAGRLDPDRLRRHQKLATEESRNSETIAERRTRNRAFAKLVKGVVRTKRQRHEE